METLTLSKPPSEGTEHGYKASLCDYCGQEMRFLTNVEGHNAECPHCGRVIRLGAVEIPAALRALEIHQTAGQRVRLSGRTPLRMLALILGCPLFVAGLLTLIGLMFTPFHLAETLFRALILGLTLLAISAGLLLMIEGRRTKGYWVCSVCERKLATHEDLVCGSCSAELS
jgi:uncharacterized paraquat-inducible protein A